MASKKKPAEMIAVHSPAGTTYVPKTAAAKPGTAGTIVKVEQPETTTQPKAAKGTAKPESKAKPKTEPKTAKAQQPQKPEANLRLVIGTDGSIKTDKAWSPAATAAAVTVRTEMENANAAADRGIGALCDLFRMDIHHSLGFQSREAFGYSLLSTLAVGGKATSTCYGWIQSASAMVALQSAKIDLAPFTMDGLKIVHAHGKQEPELMAMVATALVNEPDLRNTRGKIDIGKARKFMDGQQMASSKGTQSGKTREQKIGALAARAKKFGGNRDAAIDLLTAAIAKIKAGK
jgi:hypothetical protein